MSSSNAPVELPAFTRSPAEEVAEGINVSSARALLGLSRSGPSTTPPMHRGVHFLPGAEDSLNSMPEGVTGDPLDATAQWPGDAADRSEEAAPSVEDLFDLFYRLRDDECFEDWLQLGIPTTLEPETEGDVDRYSSSEEDADEDEDEEGEEGRSAALRRYTVAQVSGPGGHRGSQRTLGDVMLNSGQRNAPLISRGLLGTFRRQSDVFKSVRPRHMSTETQVRHQRVRMERIIDNRTSHTAGFVAGDTINEEQETVHEDGSTSTHTPHLRLRRPPVLKTFNFQTFREQTQKHMEQMVVTLDAVASPLTFYEFVERLHDLLTKITESDFQPCDVEAARALMLTAEDLSEPTFAADLLLEYVATFVNAQHAQNKLDFDDRDEVLAEGVLLRHECNRFVQSALSLRARIREVERFRQLMEASESEVVSALQHLDSLVTTIQRSVDFPKKRAALRGESTKQMEAAVEACLEALKKLTADYSTCSVAQHRQWRDTLLDSSYSKLHEIAGAWDMLSLGYLDADVVHGQAVVQDHTDIVIKTTTVAMRDRVRQLRVDEHYAFHEIGKYVKQKDVGMMIGLQLCMTSRWLFKETSSDFDDEWGFKTQW